MGLRTRDLGAICGACGPGPSTWNTVSSTWDSSPGTYRRDPGLKTFVLDPGSAAFTWDPRPGKFYVGPYSRKKDQSKKTYFFYQGIKVNCFLYCFNFNLYFGGKPVAYSCKMISNKHNNFFSFNHLMLKTKLILRRENK